MFDYPTINKFAEESGYSESAIRAKMSDGTWQENHQWIKAPDGRLLIIVEGIKQWVETGQVSMQRLKPASKSVSCIKGSAAAKGLNLSPPPLI